MALVRPDNEDQRLTILRDLQLVGSERLAEYDALVEAAAAVFEAPIALISLIEETEQWFKSKCGLGVDGTSRDVSFCQYAITGHDVFIIPDAMDDPRFRDNPLVTGDPFIRFYAGCPLSLDGVHNLGTLCVIDRVPRTPSDAQIQQLIRFAKAVEGLIKAHSHKNDARAALALVDEQRQQAAKEREVLDQITSLSGFGAWEMDLAKNTLTWSDKTREIHEVDPDYVPNVETAISFYAPEARPVITEAVERAVATGNDWDLELPFVTAKGRSIWVRAVGRPVYRDGQVVRLVGAFRDVTHRVRQDRAIRASEALQRAVLTAVSEGILFIGYDGVVQSCNPAAADFFGMSRETIVGAHISGLAGEITCDALGPADCCRPMKAAVETPERVKDLVVGISHEGRSGIRWAKLNAVALDKADGQDRSGVVVSLTDVTKTKVQADTLQVIFDNFPGGVVHYDENLNFVSCNDEFQRLLDVPDHFIEHGYNLEDYFRYNAERGEYGPGDQEEHVRQRLAMVSAPSAHIYERVTSEGCVLEVRGTPLPDGGILSTFNDVTERKRIEHMLVEKERIAREKSDELEVILANMRQGVSVFDKDARLVHWNQQYIDIFGKQQDEVRVGATLRDLLLAEQARGDFQGDIDDHLADLIGRLENGEVVRSLFKHGSGKIVSSAHAPLPDGGWIGTHEDVTQREKAAEEIAYAAHHDTLTGLANRTLFDQRLEDALMDRSQGRDDLVLFLIDLDHFKPVNDTYGHPVGDALLQQVAWRLQECVRSSDLVARLGGDEFAIIMSDPRVGENLPVEIAERIVGRIRSPFAIDGHTIQVGVSIGIAKPAEQDMDPSTVVTHADRALYEVKRTGRNGYRFYDEDVEKALAKKSA